MKNIIKTKNFEISDFTIIGIAIVLMIVGGSLPIPLADSKPPSSSSKSSNLSDGDSPISVMKANNTDNVKLQMTRNKSELGRTEDL